MNICIAKSDFFIEKLINLNVVKTRDINKGDRFEYSRVKVKWNSKKSKWKIVREGQIGNIRYEVFFKDVLIEALDEEGFNSKYETLQDKRERIIDSLGDDLFYDI